MYDKEKELLNFKLVSRSPSSEGTIKRVDVFLLREGRLSEKYTSVAANKSGTYPVLVKDPQNTRLLFLVNNDMVLEPAEGESGTLENLLSKTTPAVDYAATQPMLFYTGEKDLSGISEPMVNVPIIRSLARLSLKMQSETTIKIDSCIISNIADRSYIFPSSTVSPAGLNLISASLEGSHFTVSPTTPQSGFLYLYESENANSKAVFFVKINGVRNKLEVSLPARIERNKDYCITINSRGATLFGSLEILPWEKGTELNANPAPFAPLAENVESALPTFIYLNATGDTIFAPAGSASCLLDIRANVQVELRTESNIGIEPVSEATSRSSYLGNKFKLTFADKNINEASTYSKIYIKDQSASQYYDQYLVVARPAHRTHFVNLSSKAAIHGRNVNFDGYIDGLISDITFSSPPLKVISQTVDADFNWLRLDRNTETSYRIQGGFKPNDRKALGQDQESSVKVEYPDGLVEEFKFTRKRYSIPVVLIAGKYWSKFNMRGNSKRYEDQIGFDKDVDDLFEYLKSCPDNMYVYYAGANYKGRSRQGMYLRKRAADNQLFYPDYTKYDTGSITDASPYLHCPEGYELPHRNDFGAVMNRTVSLTLPENGNKLSYTSSTSASYDIERHQRNNIVIDEVMVNQMYHARVTEKSTGNSLVWTGTGHQWDNSGVDLSYWIYALINAGSSDYYTFINNRNLSKMESQNSNKTRLVRCIKSPVTYII
ncbi:hypothetical protein AAH088_15460 [Bacteroides hominis]|uniref:hypothetical protein n=1 Tax=Bacteroides hominis TaxID=2763023 RepID=UPI0039C2E195